MTVEERFERPEHFTAGMWEEQRRQREEDRQLWRDTQRQINELSVRMIQWAEESRAEDRRLKERLEQYAAESRAADEKLREAMRELDERLGARIDALVSAMGQFLPRNPAAS